MTEAKETQTGKIYRILFRKAIHVSEKERVTQVVVYAPHHALDSILVRDESEFLRKFEIL